MSTLVDWFELDGFRGRSARAGACLLARRPLAISGDRAPPPLGAASLSWRRIGAPGKMAVVPLTGRKSRSGRIAQLVEQLTLNQRVQGSKSLCAHHKHQGDEWVRRGAAVTVCSGSDLPKEYLRIPKVRAARRLNRVRRLALNSVDYGR